MMAIAAVVIAIIANVGLCVLAMLVLALSLVWLLVHLLVHVICWVGFRRGHLLAARPHGSLCFDLVVFARRNSCL